MIENERDDGLGAVKQRECIEILENTQSRLTNIIRINRISEKYIEKDVLFESYSDLMVDRD